MAFRPELPLRGFDLDLRKRLAAAMTQDGVTLHAAAPPIALEKTCRRRAGAPRQWRGNRGRCRAGGDRAASGDGGPWAGAGRRAAERGWRCHRRRAGAKQRPVDLCGRRRDRPHQPHSGGDPRGPGLRRPAVWRARRGGRLRQRAERGVFDAGNRHGRPYGRRGDAAFRGGRRVRDGLPSDAGDAVGARRAGLYEAARRRRQRPRGRRAYFRGPRPAKWFNSSPSPCECGRQRPISTRPWRCIRPWPRNSSPCARRRGYCALNRFPLAKSLA